MPDNLQPDQTRLDPQQYLNIVQAAMDPDERKFMKVQLGQESPDIGDYLLPQGRFKQARAFRDEIRRSVLGQAIQYASGATQGEANAMFPGFPQAPGSIKPGPEVQVERSIVPDTFDISELQHPGGAIPTVRPIGADTGVQSGRTGVPNVPSYYQSPGEGTRGLSTIVPDPNAILPPSFQALLAAKTHQAGLQPPQPVQPSAELVKHQQGLELGVQAFRAQTGRDPNPIEQQEIYRQVTGYFAKPTAPGTPEYGKITGEAATALAKGQQAVPQAQAELTATQAKGAKDEADARETNTLMTARLEELLARGALERSQAGQIDTKSILPEAGKLLELFKAGLGSQLIDQQGLQTLLKSTIDRVSTELQAAPTQPGVIGKLLGQTTGPGITVQPRPGVPGLQPVAPQAAPSPLTPPPEAAPVPFNEDMTALRAMGQRMKEGDIQVYKGQKYKRTARGLEKVKE